MSNLCDNQINMSALALHEFIADYTTVIPNEEYSVFDMKKFKLDSGFKSVGTNVVLINSYDKDLLASHVGQLDKLVNHESTLTFGTQGQPLATHALAWIAKKYNTRIECTYAEIGMQLSGVIIVNEDGSLHSKYPIPLFEALVEKLNFDSEYAEEFDVIECVDFLSSVSYKVDRTEIIKSFLLTDAPVGMSLEHTQQIAHIAYENSKRSLNDVCLDFFINVFDALNSDNNISKAVPVLEKGIKKVHHIESLNIQKTADVIGLDVFSYHDTIKLIKEVIKNDIDSNSPDDLEGGMDEVGLQIDANATPILKMVLHHVADLMREE